MFIFLHQNSSSGYIIETWLHLAIKCIRGIRLYEKLIATKESLGRSHTSPPRTFPPPSIFFGIDPVCRFLAALDIPALLGWPWLKSQGQVLSCEVQASRTMWKKQRRSPVSRITFSRVFVRSSVSSTSSEFTANFGNAFSLVYDFASAPFTTREGQDETIL